MVVEVAVEVHQLVSVFPTPIFPTLGSSGNANAGPGEGEDVVELTEGNFRKKVVMEKELGWLVEFYAPW